MDALDLHRTTTRAPHDRRSVLRPGRRPYLLSVALGVVAAAGSGLSVAPPSVLTGVPGSNGNMRGTAVVVLVVGVPVLTLAVLGASRGSARAFVVWLGTLGYLLYQSVLFCFATPYNNLFLLYVAHLGLAVWSIVMVLRSADLDAFGARLSPRAPVRFVAGFALVVVALNATAWLAGIVPTVLSDHPGELLTDTGLSTNPVYVQDLAIWLPLLATSAVAAWRRQVWGQLVTAAMLAMFVLESISISVDQWFGSQADPASSASSMTMVPAFAVVALVMAVALVAFLRHLDRR